MVLTEMRHVFTHQAALSGPRPPHPERLPSPDIVRTSIGMRNTQECYQTQEFDINIPRPAAFNTYIDIGNSVQSVNLFLFLVKYSSIFTILLFLHCVCIPNAFSGLSKLCCFKDLFILYCPFTHFSAKSVMLL